MEGFAIKSANKTYTQSQTIVVTKEQLNAQVTAENGPKDRNFGIREIISQKNLLVDDEHEQAPATES